MRNNLSLSATRRGFTLIELLIVVAIIAILAAIAVPNFLEAQTRSKVSRVKSDMRALAVALESYYSDYNCYLIDANHYVNYYPTVTPMDWTHIRVYRPLSTPVAYITSIPIDTYFNPKWDLNRHYFNYHNWDKWERENLSDPRMQGGSWYNEGIRQDWCMYSMGPNMVWEGADWYPITMQYDPTNGTVSYGDISRWGP
ncbi:MAG: prepilin-type N-terminal cleavage/methylation domain-containing protein [bacterium]